MAAPDPSMIVTDPVPLNSTAFPFRVQPFPGKDLVQNGVFRTAARGAEVAKSGPDEKQRFEN